MEDLEQIMRRIHVLFAKCEPYGDESDGRIIVPKKEVFRLLEKLNLAVIHMMDAYEGTAESRERGLNAYQRESEKIRENAQAGADDVYAASLIYTDNMLEELSDVLADAKEELWEQYARMAGRLDVQAGRLLENQEEIKRQLSAMAQGGKYLKLIERENIRLKRIEAARASAENGGDEYDGDPDGAWDEDEYDGDLDEAWDGYEEDDGEQTSAAAAPGSGTDVPETGDGTVPGPTLEAPEGDKAQAASPGNGSGALNGAAGSASSGKRTGAAGGGKRRKQPSRGSDGRCRASAASHARMSPDLETEWAAQEAERPVRKIGTAFYEDVGQAYDTPVKKVTYEVKVNQAYFDQLGEGNVDLDAEYYQWKEEQEQAAAGGESAGGAEQAEGSAPEETGQADGKNGRDKKKRRSKFGKRK